MISEKLKAELEEWCRKHSTRLSRIHYNEEEDNTIIKRYDGQGISSVLHCIKTEKGVKDLIDESNRLDKELNM